MIIKIVILFLFSISFSGYAQVFYPEKLATKMVRIVLKDKNISLIESIEIPENSQKPEPLEIYKFHRNENNQSFYAVFTQAKGRYELFDYLLVVNINFAIEKVSILKYRSEHGGEIASKKWLEQFVNYSAGELRYKKEISALSGATISANSLVDDLPKVLKILKNSI